MIAREAVEKDSEALPLDTPDDWQLLREFVIASAHELLVGTGVRVRQLDVPLAIDREHVDDFVSLVGFLSDNLNGSVVIRASREFALLSHPMRGRMTLAEEDAIDWMGELGNQLLGRIKNRCVNRGLDFQIGYPHVVSGKAVGVKSSREAKSFVFQFECNGLDVAVFVDAILRSGAALFSAATHDAQREGQVLFLEAQRQSK